MTNKKPLNTSYTQHKFFSHYPACLAKRGNAEILGAISICDTVNRKQRIVGIAVWSLFEGEPLVTCS